MLKAKERKVAGKGMLVMEVLNALFFFLFLFFLFVLVLVCFSLGRDLSIVAVLLSSLSLVLPALLRM